MMLDVRNLCSDGQSVAIGVGSVLSDKAIPRGATAVDQLGNTLTGDMGMSPVPIFAQVTTTFTSGGAGTLQAQLVHADTEDLLTNAVVLQETVAIALATLKAGFVLPLGKFLPIGTTKAFWGFKYIVGGFAMTAGNITAGVGQPQTSPTA